MFKTTFQIVILLASLVAGSVPAIAMADAAGDQYAVAAGHYAQRRWKLAVEEFDAFLTAHPKHARAARANFFAGEAFVQLGQFAKAHDHFSGYLRQAASGRFGTGKYVKQATFRVGETSYLAGDDKAARGLLQDFRKKYPNDPLHAYALPYLAEIELRAKKNSLAEQLFEQALKNFATGPLSEDCRFGLARARERLGKTQAAADAYRLLAANDKGLLADAAQFRLGAMAYGEKQYAEAAAAFELIETRFPKSRLRIKSRYWLGLSYKAQNKWDLAAGVLLAAIEREPQHSLAAAMQYQAADAMLEAGKHQQAVALFDRLLDTSPQSPWADDALLGKILARLQSGDHPSVVTLAAQMQQQYPQSPLQAMARQSLARSLIRAKQSAQAIDVLRPLIAAETKPHGRDMERYLLGLSYHRQGEFDEALAQYRAIAADAAEPLKASLQVARATTLSAVERYEDAIKLFQAYLTAHPDGPQSPGAHAELAGCFAALGRWESAKKHHNTLLADGQIATEASQELMLSTTHRLAELAYRAGERAWAAQLFTLLTADGNPPQYVSKGLSGLAWSQLKGQDISSSAETFQRLIDQYPDSPLAAEAALARGKALERLGKQDAALAMFHLVIDRHSATKQFPAALLAAALAHDRLKQQKDALKLYARILTEYPDHKQIDLVIYQSAWLLRDRKEDKQADARFQQIHTTHPDSPYWPDATYRLAERAVAAKQFDDARRFLAAVVAADKVEKKLLAHAYYLQGQIAITRGQWDRVEGPMSQIVQHYADSPLRLPAEFWIAETSYRQGQYDKAEERFERLSRKTAGRGDRWLAMIPLRRAQVLAQKKKWEDAFALAKGIAAAFPDFKQQYEVDYLLGRCHASQADFAKARIAYRRVTQSPQGAKTETAAMAQWMIGESWFHQQQHDEAIKQYLKVEILYNYPDWQAAALLQAGKCYEQLGDWQQATAMYSQLLSKYADTTHVEETQRRLRVVQQRAEVGTSDKR